MNTLPQHLRQQLLDSPATGVDYHVVDVTLTSGRRVRDVAVVNCSLIACVRWKPFVWFSGSDIIGLQVTHRRWGFGQTIVA